MLRAKQSRPCIWGKRLPGFSEEKAGEKEGKGQNLLGKGGRPTGVVRSIVGHDCNFRFPPASYRIRAKMMSDPGHFFGVFVWLVVWHLWRF